MPEIFRDLLGLRYRPRHLAIAPGSMRGYTLIELMVALTIVVILALVSIPSFVTIIKNYRISGVADNLYYFLQNARAEAVKRNTNVYVSFTPGDSWCYGMNAGSSCNCTVANSCGLGTFSASTSQQITLSTTLGSNQVYFEGTHAAANASGTITFTLYGQTSLITLTIGRLGSLQVCSTGIGGYTAC